MRNLIFALIGLVTICACDDDNEELHITSSIVQEAESFIDTRDNHEYQCVRVGDQIWMAENLCYLPSLAPLAGCYTWEEESVKASELPLFNEEYIKAVKAMINNPDYDWNVIYPSTSPIMTTTYIMTMYLDYLDYGATQNDLNDMYKEAFPEFFSLLEPTFDLFKVGPALDHISKQEAANGHYSKEYGYLYTYTGALAAVPAEGGWRLPSDEDWTKLETTLGMDNDEATGLEAWRGKGVGKFLKEGGDSRLNFLLGGGNLYSPAKEEYYIKKDEGGYYWSSTIYYQGLLTPDQEADENMTEAEKIAAVKTTVILRSFAIYSDQVWRGTIRVNTGYRPTACSVRLVRDAN